MHCLDSPEVRKSPAFHRFIQENPDCLQGLPDRTEKVCVALCDLASTQRSVHYTHHAESVIRSVRRLLAESPLGGEVAAGAAEIGLFGRALALNLLQAGIRILNHERYLPAWIGQALDWARLDASLAEAFLDWSPLALAAFDPEKFSSLNQLAFNLRQGTGPRLEEPLKAFFAILAQSGPSVSLKAWAELLKLADRVSRVSPEAAASLVGQAPDLVREWSSGQIENWVAIGLAVCRREQDFLNYFGGHSIRLMKRSLSGEGHVQLKDVMTTLGLIVHAFLGQTMRLQSNHTLARTKGFSGGAATDGRTIYLPIVAPDFDLFKLMALHQAALIEYMASRDQNLDADMEPTALHGAADRLLVQRLPNLARLMEHYDPVSEGGEHPARALEMDSEARPWWGDWLPHLAGRSKSAVETVIEKAAGMSDLSGDTLEAMVSAMMDDGELDPDRLWSRLQLMLDAGESESPEPEEPDDEIRTFLYPEWDAALWDYKKDWCLVRELRPGLGPEGLAREMIGSYSGLIARLRRQFLGLRPETNLRLRAQSSGDDLDLDALVAAVADARAGLVPSDNIYLRKDKRERDVTVLFLLDASRSTEEKSGESRVIDIFKQAMLVMAEALEAVGDRFAVYGFGSEGRFRVDLLKVKGFKSAWNDESRDCLAGLSPKGMTRMGAVMRHAGFLLQQQTAATRLVILLTDGRPFDMQYGDFSYAVEDTRKAFLEARAMGQKHVIITSDEDGSSYLNHISPQTRNIILPQVELLPSLLPSLYRRLTFR